MAQWDRGPPTAAERASAQAAEQQRNAEFHKFHTLE
jgi:hypothetical protein